MNILRVRYKITSKATLPKVLLAVFSLFFGGYLSAQEPFPEAKQGILDLRRVSNFNEKAFSLGGEWQVFPGELVMPIAKQKGTPVYFQVPGMWGKNAMSNGLIPDKTGCMTYSLRVFLPSSIIGDPSLQLKVPDCYSAYRLFLNGKEIARNGTVACDADKAVPYWKPLQVPLEFKTDTLDYVLWVSNYHHAKGGLDEALVVLPAKEAQQTWLVNATSKWVLFGAMVMAALFFLGLFLFGRNEKPLFWMFLFCLVFSYRVIGADDYLLNQLFSGIPFWLSIRLEYAEICLSLVFMSRYIATLFPDESPKRLLRGLEIISLVYLLLVVVSPSVFFTRWLEFYLVFVMTGILTGMWVFLRATFHQQAGALYASLSIVGLFFSVLYSILTYLQLLPDNQWLLLLGYFWFFMFQALIHSYRFAYKLDQARIKAEAASQAKTEFLSMISHEIRTPMNAVLGLTRLLMEEKPRQDQVAYLESLHLSGENLLSLINDVLDFSKLQAGKIELQPRPNRLDEMLKQVSLMLRDQAIQKGIDLRLDVAEGMDRWVEVDGLRLNQILINLIGNAIKFTREGEVVLGIREISESELAHQVEFFVKDTGIGIPADKLDRIFERFAQVDGQDTREFGGTGLGLAIVKHLLLQMGTKIEVTSQQGVGSRFSFVLELPKSDPPALKSPEIAVTTVADPSRKPILLVEDNQINMTIAKRFLEKWGYRTVDAKNGQEALDLFETDKFSLVLMDLQMPVMSGFIATRMLRERGAKLPILALTANVLSETRDLVLEAGMNDSIPKPFRPEELRNTVEKWIALLQEA